MGCKVLLGGDAGEEEGHANWEVKCSEMVGLS